MSSSHLPSVALSARVVSFETARHLVEQHALSVAPTEVETVNLLAALAGFWRRDCSGPRLSPFARATRDGYAVRAADVAKTPARLDVIGEIKAGDLPDNLTVDHGQAVSIMTGAALPPGRMRW